MASIDAGHVLGGVGDHAACDEAADRRDVAGTRRDVANRERDEAAGTRDRGGERRDRNAGGRDRAAVDRDLRARGRDRAAADRDAQALNHGGSGERDHAADAAAARLFAADDRNDAADDRMAGARDRRGAGRDRGTASSDRGGASADRSCSAQARADDDQDRARAHEDRAHAAVDLAYASLDGLTGAYTRSAGWLELQREVHRARRTGDPLVLAFLDVVGLKKVNDTAGHAAGDQVLVRVVQAVRARLRPYDLVIRYGGDEFVCVLAGITLGEAAEWRERLREGLAADAVTVGLSELQEDDEIHLLVQRADEDLYRQR